MDGQVPMGNNRDFTVICPIHNEAEMLPITLQSIYNLRPSEAIFCLDRCTDSTYDIVKRYREHYSKNTDTRLREYSDEEGSGWRSRVPFLRTDAYLHTRKEVILNTDADIRLDPNIGGCLDLIPSHYRLISFGYLDYPWNIQEFLRAIISELTPVHGYAGLFAFCRKAWLETRDAEVMKKLLRNEDTYLQLAIQGRYMTTHINTRSLHLTPTESKEDHYNRGYSAWNLQHERGEMSSFLHSIVMVRPSVYTGYRHAKSMDGMRPNRHKRRLEDAK